MQFWKWAQQRNEGKATDSKTIHPCQRIVGLDHGGSLSIVYSDFSAASELWFVRFTIVDKTGVQSVTDIASTQKGPKFLSLSKSRLLDSVGKGLGECSNFGDRSLSRCKQKSL